MGHIDNIMNKYMYDCMFFSFRFCYGQSLFSSIRADTFRIVHHIGFMLNNNHSYTIQCYSRVDFL